MIPQTSMAKMGLTLKRRVAMKTATHRAMLSTNSGRLTDGVPKFSLFINSRAAAAMRPMMAGRRAAKTFFTHGASLWVSR